MHEIVKPGVGLIFMKVGTHAREDLVEIIERKTREIDQTGYALWGYGGNTCHPLTMVQPFARDFEQRDDTIFLCMQPIESHHFAEPERATTFSSDGVTWEPIPPTINVLGSRYALAIADLRPEEFDLPLVQTRVAIGNSTGRRGDQYVQGRVDKACLEITERPDTVAPDEERKVHIGLTAQLTTPYAVLVR